MTGRHYGRLGIYPGTFAPSAEGGLPLTEVTIAAALKTVGYRSGMVGKWHLGTHEFLPVHHGFDFYHGIPMTQNACISNIETPGSVHPRATAAEPYTSVGPCPILNDSTIVQQDDMLGEHELLDVIDIDEQYDAAAAGFIRENHATRTPWFFYFCSHHTHVPQFASAEMTGFSTRGLMGDSLSMLDRSVGRLTNLTAELRIDEQTLVIFSADNGKIVMLSRFVARSVSRLSNPKSITIQVAPATGDLTCASRCLILCWWSSLAAWLRSGGRLKRGAALRE